MINFPHTVLEPIYLILQEIQGSSFFGIHEVEEGAEERILAMEELNSKFKINILKSFLVCVEMYLVSLEQFRMPCLCVHNVVCVL